MLAMFHWRRRERKLDVFFSPKKPKMFAGGRCTLIAQNVVELFNSNCGVRVRVRFSCINDVSRGPVWGPEIV